MLKNLFVLFLVVINVLSTVRGQDLNYYNNKIVFKLKPEFANAIVNNKIKSPDLQKVLPSNSNYEIKALFSFIKTKPKNQNYYIGNIYQLTTDGDIPVEKIIRSLISSGLVVYAEPRYYHYLLDLPNDPFINYQYYLATIQAFDAWQLNQGDSSIIIGIVDTGIDIDHEDLFGNIYYNFNDPINGIDDDNDGFIDNFRGWDMGCNDNNPQIENNPHGIRVSGIAAARTNNNIGIAGTGYKTKFLPVKISDLNDNLVNEYEGMVYAAEMGCQIINCSWGGVYYSNLGKDVVDYIALEKNILIVAAAGNSSDDDLYYPASFDHVFSIAATNNLDRKWSSSTFNVLVDFCAPGENIFSPGLDNTYAYRSGTSYAAPIVSACAAIVKSVYPQYNGIQLGEILRKSTDIIDTIAANMPYAGQLGSGRVNLLKAITNNIQASAVLHSISVTDNNDNIFKTGDTVKISGIITNYLIPVSFITITCVSNSPYVTFINNLVQIPALSTLQDFQLSQPISFTVDQYTPADQIIYIELNINAGGYPQKQNIKLKINQSYANIAWSDISTSVTSVGKIGYLNTLPPEGNGFTLNGKQLLFEAGFIAGRSNYQVSSCFRGYNDFKTTAMIANIPQIQNDSLIKTVGRFNDQLAYDHGLNIEVGQKTYCWNKPGLNFIVWEYQIKNLTALSLNNVYAGIFADWDIIDFHQNETGFIDESSCCFTRTKSGELIYAGIALLSDFPVHHYAFDNVDGGNGGIDISDGFSIEERWFSLTNSRNFAGTNPSGNDVAQVISAGPINLSPFDSAKVAFAFATAGNEYNLKKMIQKARDYYNKYLIIPEPVCSANQIFIYPNPATQTIYIDNQITNNLNYIIYNSNGGLLLDGIITEKKQAIHLDNLLPGVYFIHVFSDKYNEVKKIIIIR